MRVSLLGFALLSVVSLTTAQTMRLEVTGNYTVLPAFPYGAQIQLDLQPRWCEVQPSHLPSLAANHSYTVQHPNCWGTIYLLPKNPPPPPPTGLETLTAGLLAVGMLLVLFAVCPPSPHF